jgi:hypothetical protein
MGIRFGWTCFIFHGFSSKKAGGIPVTKFRRTMFIAAQRKPNSVPVSLSTRRGCHFSVTQIALRLGWINHPATYPRMASLSPRAGALRCLVLLPVGFAVPSMSPPMRCALTAPFHPCFESYNTANPPTPRAVSFCCTFRRIAPP